MAGRARIYVDLELAPERECELPPDAAHHVRDVLRLAPDAELVLFNGRGGEYVARLRAVGRGGVRARVEAWRETHTESALDITLVQSISRGERMDYTLQKAVELGVRRIVPVTSLRTVVRLDNVREEKRLAHWRGIVRHAAEQSGRTCVPEVAAVMPLREWSRGATSMRTYLLQPDAARSLAGEPPGLAHIALVAGPEGGFAEEERAALRDAGAIAVRLGPRILRTETAAVTALSVLQSRFGDLA